MNSYLLWCLMLTHYIDCLEYFTGSAYVLPHFCVCLTRLNYKLTKTITNLEVKLPMFRKLRDSKCGQLDGNNLRKPLHSSEPVLMKRAQKCGSLFWCHSQPLRNWTEDSLFYKKKFTKMVFLLFRQIVKKSALRGLLTVQRKTNGLNWEWCFSVIFMTP